IAVALREKRRAAGQIPRLGEAIRARQKGQRAICRKSGYELLAGAGGSCGGRWGVRSGGLVRSEVAVAGASGKFALAVGRNDLNLNGAEGAVLFCIGRVVAESVLIANVASDLIANAVHVVDIFREEGDAAGGSGNIFQGAHGLLAVLAVFIAEE